MLIRIVAVIAVLVSSLAHADDMSFEDVWARATPTGAGTAAVYGRIENRGKTARQVIGVSSDVARSGMIHRTVQQDGMMRMLHQKKLLVGSGESIVFEPGGLHIMLMGLKAPLSPGEKFSVELAFSDGERITGRVTVGQVGQMRFSND